MARTHEIRSVRNVYAQKAGERQRSGGGFHKNDQDKRAKRFDWRDDDLLGLDDELDAIDAAE